MAESVVFLNSSNGLARVLDFTEGPDGTGYLPYKIVQNDVVVGDVTDGSVDFHFDTTYTQIVRYPDGAVKNFLTKNADGSQLELVYADPGPSPDRTIAVILGEPGDQTVHGKLLESHYTSPTRDAVTNENLPGATVFSVDQTFEDGHLTNYQVQTSDGQARLTATLDIATLAASVSLVTPNGSPAPLTGTGYIDALIKLDPTQLIGQDGNGFISDHGAAFDVISDHGIGLTSLDGKTWSVISNDGGTLTPLTNGLISQDGNSWSVISNDRGTVTISSLISLDDKSWQVLASEGGKLIGQDGNGWGVISNDGGTITQLIGQDGNGLNQLDVARLLGPSGSIVAQGGGNIVAQGGLNLVNTNGSNIVAQGGLNIVAQGGLNFENPKTAIGLEIDRAIDPDVGQVTHVGSDGGLEPIPGLTLRNPLYHTLDLEVESVSGVTSYEDFVSNFVDLTIPAAFLDHTTSGTPYHQGDIIAASWQVQNLGLAASQVTTTQIYLSTDGTTSGIDRLIGSVDDPAIAGGTAIVDNFEYHVPSDLPPGTYYLYVVANAVDYADPKTNSLEDRTNNISSELEFTVESASSVPDLSVPVVLLDKDSGHSGDTVNVSWQVKENAFIDASASTTTVYLSTDQRIDASDRVLIDRFQPSILPGNASGDMVDVTVPGDLAPGTYYILVGADSTNDVAEADEANNTGVAQFTILADDTTATIALATISEDDFVGRDELAAGVIVAGTTTGVENGKIVTVTLENIDGSILGTTTATVQDGAFSVALPAVDFPVNGPSGTLFVGASVTDTAGHTADVSGHALAYDLTPPGLAIVNANVVMQEGGVSFDVLGTAGPVTSTTVHIMLGSADLGRRLINSDTISSPQRV